MIVFLVNDEASRSRSVAIPDQFDSFPSTTPASDSSWVSTEELSDIPVLKKDCAVLSRRGSESLHSSRSSS